MIKRIIIFLGVLTFSLLIPIIVFSADKEFHIIQSFQATLDRSPNSSEIQYWLNQPVNNLGKIDHSGYSGIRRALNGTVNNQSTERVNVVNNIYLRALKRNPEAAELNAQITYVSPTNLIRQQLFTSEERRLAIIDLYVNILSRNLAQSDLDFYYLTRSAVSDIAFVLLASVERQSVINQLMQAVLGRNATDTEIDQFNSQVPNRQGAQWPYYYHHDIWTYALSLLEDQQVETSAELLQAEDLEYQGAFRLPAGDGSDERSWDWGGSALAYYPDGDPSGPSDGYPGSLYGTGHEQYQYISEISIPEPVISSSKNLNDLNTAETLQTFQDIRGNLFGELEMPNVGLEYLPAQGSQTSGKLYFAWGQHLQEGDYNPSHGWFDLDLNNANRQGPWSISGYQKYVTTDYLFSIPASWADTYINGNYLATGRYRNGGQGAQGPSLLAIAPWKHGNPPAANSSLDAIPLLLYQSYYDDPSASIGSLDNYHHSDQWGGGAWLTKNDKAAIIFVGVKGQGNCWYGYYDGTEWPEEPPYPDEGPGERGWWSSSFQDQIIFYDPADLAAVAQGTMESYQPQPYAIMNIEDQMYYTPTTEFRYIGGVTFDRNNSLLYVSEIRGDQDNQRPLIHVWQIK